jgi:hypothetical protein
MSVLADCFSQHLVRVGYVGSDMTRFRKRHKERKKTRKSKLGIKWSNKYFKNLSNFVKICQKLSKSCQKIVKKLSKS